MQQQRKLDTGFLAIIGVLHLIWYIAGMLWQHYYNGDSYEYIYLADSIRQGHYYSGNPALPLNEYKQSLRTPVYSLFLLLFYNLAGYKSWLIFLAQNLVSVASCYLAFKAFAPWQSNGRYRWYYILFLGLYPAQMVFSNMIVPDILLQLFLVLYFRGLLRALQQYRPYNVLAMSIWLILATLTKPIVYPFLFLHALFAVIYTLKQKRPMILAWGILPLLVMTGYGSWNKERTGLFHISSVQSVNLLEHNMNRFLEHRYGKAYSDSVIGSTKKEIAALPHLKDKYEYASQKASAIMRHDLVPYALFHARESARFFLEPGKSEIDLFSGSLTYHRLTSKVNFYSSYQEGGITGALHYLAQYPVFPLVLLIILFNILRLIGAARFMVSRKIPLVIRIACGIYVVYFAAITGPVANTRYFLPVLPILSGMAALGWSMLPSMIFKKRTTHRYE